MHYFLNIYLLKSGILLVCFSELAIWKNFPRACNWVVFFQMKLLKRIKNTRIFSKDCLFQFFPFLLLKSGIFASVMKLWKRFFNSWENSPVNKNSNNLFQLKKTCQTSFYVKKVHNFRFLPLKKLLLLCRKIKK